MRSHTISTNPAPRRNRTRAAWTRNAPREHEERIIIQRDISIGQQLGQVDFNHDPGVWQDINDEQTHHHEPIVGSYLNHEWDENLEDLPSAAHASYHRARRYAETRDRLERRWMQLEKDATAAFLLCQRKTSNWTYKTGIDGSDEFPTDLCTCEPHQVHSRNIDCFDIISK
jgi:hypothetical protein